MTDPVLVWFRQDLRLADQAALAAAAKEGPILAIYVLDDHTPGDWRIGGAQRWWLHHSLEALARDLKKRGVPLVLRRGVAAAEVAKVAGEVRAARVHALAHYEPWWKRAEEDLGKQIELRLHPGRLLDDPDHVLTGAGKRYRIFTPFWRTLSQRLPPPEPEPVPAKLDGLSTPPRSDHLTDWALLPTEPNWAEAFGGAWNPGEAGCRGGACALPAQARRLRP